MRWLLTIAYSVLILVGFWFILGRYETSHGGGSGASPRDVAPSAGLVYAKRNIIAGESVKPEDFASFPALTWPDGQVLVTVSAERKQIDSGDVNGGKPALLCGGTFSEKVPVQAAMCGPADCIAIVTFPGAKLQPLGDALKAPGTKLSLRRGDAANCS
jgi:hypothetical protein